MTPLLEGVLSKVTGDGGTATEHHRSAESAEARAKPAKHREGRDWSLGTRCKHIDSTLPENIHSRETMARRTEPTPESFLPLTSVVFEILVTLANGDRHGYSILTEIRDRSRAPLRVGSLYRAIGRLLDDGLIAGAGRAARPRRGRSAPAVPTRSPTSVAASPPPKRGGSTRNFATRERHGCSPIGGRLRCSSRCSAAFCSSRSPSAFAIASAGRWCRRSSPTAGRRTAGSRAGRFAGGAMDVVRAGLAERVISRRERRNQRSTWEAIWQDLRIAARRLNHSRGFTVVALLTLALGVGANTALFQLLDAVRLQPLPVPAPHELAELRIENFDGARGNFSIWRAERDLRPLPGNRAPSTGVHVGVRVEPRRAHGSRPRGRPAVRVADSRQRHVLRHARRPPGHRPRADGSRRRARLHVAGRGAQPCVLAVGVRRRRPRHRPAHHARARRLRDRRRDAARVHRARGRAGASTSPRRCAPSGCRQDPAAGSTRAPTGSWS